MASGTIPMQQVRRKNITGTSDGSSGTIRVAEDTSFLNSVYSVIGVKNENNDRVFFRVRTYDDKYYLGAFTWDDPGTILKNYVYDCTLFYIVK